MWFLEMLAVNLALFAAAAAALLLAAGCESLGQWGVAGWLRRPASALWATARGLTLALVLVVLGAALALILALVRVL
jgi:drug/metabolite transporter superfamily protein YnfA